MFKKVLLILGVLILAACQGTQREECNMPLTFDRDGHIQFGETADLVDSGLTTFTAMSRVFVTQYTSQEFYGISQLRNFDGVPAAAGAVYRIYLFGNAPNDILFFDTEGSDGILEGRWQAPLNSIAINTEHHIAISYDNSLTTNNPVMYIDGSSVNVTEETTPTVVQSFTDIRRLDIGNAGNSVFHGRISDYRLYDRIVPASEISEIYNTRKIDGFEKGLLVHCPILGAAGMQTFDGVELDGTNKIIDRMNGLQGDPIANFPAGAGDTLLHFGGLQWEEGRGGG